MRPAGRPLPAALPAAHRASLPCCQPAGSLLLTNSLCTLPAPPPQADEFTFRLPALGALGALRVGHDGRRDWHLERLEVAVAAGPGAGTTFYFPCARWVRGSGPGGAPSTHLHLRGYTTDPASLPVQYRLEAEVEGASGAPGPHSLQVTLFGVRGDSGVQRLDASRAAPGRTLACVFEAANVGAVERLRIGLAPADEGDASGAQG